MGRLADIKKMVSDGRVGFAMDEVMTGTHEFEPKFGSSGKRPMEFRVTWGPKHVAPWANPSSEQFMINDMEGTVTVDGLCYFAPCTGTLELRYFKDRTIRYAFEFKVEEENYQDTVDRGSPNVHQARPPPSVWRGRDQVVCKGTSQGGLRQETYRS